MKMGVPDNAFINVPFSSFLGQFLSIFIIENGDNHFLAKKVSIFWFQTILHHTV